MAKRRRKQWKPSKAEIKMEEAIQTFSINERILMEIMMARRCEGKERPNEIRIEIVKEILRGRVVPGKV